MNNLEKLTKKVNEAEAMADAKKKRYTPEKLERMQSQMALSKSGLFAALGSVKWKWLDEKIMGQPCYMSPFSIKDEVVMESDVTGRARPPRLSNTTKILNGIYEFFKYNPFFWWRDLSSDEWVWSGSRGLGAGIGFGFLKFLFCITLKGFGSPILLLLYAIKFFVIFMYALKLPEFFTAAVGTIVNIIMTFFTNSNFRLTIPYYRCTYDGDLTEPDCSHLPEPKNVMPFADMVLFYVGMILPLHMIVGEGYGKTYGQGGLSALIIVFAIVSAILIIVGGCNIVVIFSVVTFFIFKSGIGFFNVATGKDIQGGKTS